MSIIYPWLYEFLCQLVTAHLLCLVVSVIKPSKESNANFQENWYIGTHTSISRKMSIDVHIYVSNYLIHWAIILKITTPGTNCESINSISPHKQENWYKRHSIQYSKLICSDAFLRMSGCKKWNWDQYFHTPVTKSKLFYECS